MRPASPRLPALNPDRVHPEELENPCSPRPRLPIGLPAPPTVDCDRSMIRASRRSTARSRTWWPTLALAALSACAGHTHQAGSEGPSLPGRYTALTESEWTLEVVLEPSGRAYVEYAWWAGDTREIKSVPARWTQRGELVEISYGAVTDTLRYHRRLSLWRTGRWGSRPGLEGVPPVDSQSLIGVSRLWISQ